MLPLPSWSRQDTNLGVFGNSRIEYLVLIRNQKQGKRQQKVPFVRGNSDLVLSSVSDKKVCFFLPSLSARRSSASAILIRLKLRFREAVTSEVLELLGDVIVLCK